jgi:predicted regulator of Ras-like GTPase activity (Roadblock/LC7/MglB family)
VVAVRDGLVVDGRVHVGVHGDAVAALAASLFRRAGQAAADARVRFVELEAESGSILIAGMDDLALMVVLDRRVNAGQARLAVRRAASDLAALGGEG